MRWLIGAMTGLMTVLLGASMARAQTPPTRTFGSVTIDGQPAPLGTKIEALIFDKVCGENVVRRLNDEIPVGFVVDVASAGQTPGCGNDGDTIIFRVGGVQANETSEFQTGNFFRINLTAAGQAATPTPGPTPPPFGSATPTPRGAATPAATAAPGTPTAAAGGGTPTPGASGSAVPAAGGTPRAPTTTTPVGTASGGPVTGTVTVFVPDASPRNTNDDGGSAGVIWAVVVVAVLAAASVGYVWYRRQTG